MSYPVKNPTHFLLLCCVLVSFVHPGCRPDARHSPSEAAPDRATDREPVAGADDASGSGETPSRSPGEAAADVIRTRIAQRERAEAPPTPTPRVRVDADITDDGLVTAKSIRLMWTPSAVGAFSYEDAASYCRGLELGSRKDWRLPTVTELVELLAADVVPITPGRGGSLWTSSTAEHRGVITVDTSDWTQSWKEVGVAHVICVREVAD